MKVMVRVIYIKLLAIWAVFKMSTCHISYSKVLKAKDVQIFFINWKENFVCPLFCT